MMNKSKIDWCDFSWNPVTGCRHTCEYCYARKQARRFSGDIRLNKRSDQIQEVMHFDKEKEGEAYKTYTLPQPFKNESGATVPFPVGFEPTLHEYRLPMPAQKKKPANIFVCSMADLFGNWVPDEWIRRVFEACEAAPQHNYLFLTKNPTRYCRIADAGWLPEKENFWYGSTITKKGDAYFNGSIHWNTFISIEPLLENLDAGLGSFGGAKWIIVGAETGSRHDKVTPKREWIENIIGTASITQAAILLKDSKEMRAVWGDNLIRQMPCELEHEDDPEIPHCSKCDFRGMKEPGTFGTDHYCKMIGKRIYARESRTSPQWCPLRSVNNENQTDYI